MRADEILLMAVNLPAATLPTLAAHHRSRRFQLASTNGLQSFAHIDGDSHGLVTNLIHLARLGQAAAAALQETPQGDVAAAINAAAIQIAKEPRT